MGKCKNSKTIAHEADMARQLHKSVVGKLCGRDNCKGTFHPSCPHLHFQGPHFSWVWMIVFYVPVTQQVLNWTLDGDEWSPSYPNCFTPRERLPGTHWIVSWVGHKVSVIFWRTEKISLACQEWNLKMYSLHKAVACIYLYTHTAMNTTILQLVAICKIQL